VSQFLIKKIENRNDGHTSRAKIKGFAHCKNESPHTSWTVAWRSARLARRPDKIVTVKISPTYHSLRK